MNAKLVAGRSSVVDFSKTPRDASRLIFGEQLSGCAADEV
jgi:hypothetical protein